VTGLFPLLVSGRSQQCADWALRWCRFSRSRSRFLLRGFNFMQMQLFCKRVENCLSTARESTRH